MLQLKYLGPEFEFKTGVYAGLSAKALRTPAKSLQRGKVEKLFIQGGGIPSSP